MDCKFKYPKVKGFLGEKDLKRRTRIVGLGKEDLVRWTWRAGLGEKGLERRTRIGGLGEEDLERRTWTW